MRLISLIDPDNLPSKRVAEAIGSRYERTIDFHGETTEVWSQERG